MTSIYPSSSLKIFKPSNSGRSISDGNPRSGIMDSLLEISHSYIAKSEEDLKKLLYPDLEKALASLELGNGSRCITERWKEKRSSFRNVIIYGDYDVDGICSTVLALEMFLALGCSVRFFIPHRHEEGYGLHHRVTSKIADSKCDTFIVLDCGTGSGEILQELEKAGLNVFVFDHHMPGRVDPEPWLMNPQEDGDDFARNLCATTVLWTWAYKNGIMPREWLLERLDLAALATIADCMFLGDLNRGIVREGIKAIGRSKRPGLHSLIRKLDLSPKHITENDLAMKVIPSLNAPGRMVTADMCVEQLVSGTEKNVDTIIELNKKRREFSAFISGSLISNPLIESKHVFYSPDWHVGVISSVASNLCNLKNKPIVLAAPGKDSIRGTIRVPEGGNALKVLEESSDLLGKWGGHSYAAGFSVDLDNWDTLKDRLETSLARMEIKKPCMKVLEVDPGHINMKVFDEISLLGPFGKGNPRPFFFKERDGSEKVSELGRSGLHFKISSGSADLIAFNSSELWHRSRDILGWIYYPNLNFWRGKVRVQYILEAAVVDG